MRLGATADFLRSRGENPDFVQYELATPDIPEGREAAGRLCLSPCGKPIVVTYEELAEQISAISYGQHAFYLDTCFFRAHEVPKCFWDSVLAHKIVITPGVWAELAGWIEKGMPNKYILERLLAAKQTSDSAIEFEPLLANHTPEQKGAIYYLGLLGIRKHARDLVFHALSKKLEREPTESEVELEVRSVVQDRGMKLANEGLRLRGKDNLYVDESIIVRSFFRTITTRTESHILTRDKDLFEQFFKLQYLIDTHYRSMLIAKAYAAQPLNFIEENISPESPIAQGFESARVLFRPAGMEQRVLPLNPTFTNVYLSRFSDSKEPLQLQAVRFHAETEITELFRVKGITGGLNTSELNGDNLHICATPGRTLDGYSTVIGKDRFVLSRDGFNLSVVDVDMALKRFEQGAELRVVPLTNVKPETREDIFRARAFGELIPPRRNCYGIPRAFAATSDSMLALIIRMLPPWIHIVLDKTFSPNSFPDRVTEELELKRSVWLSKTPFERYLTFGDRIVLDYLRSILAHKRLIGNRTLRDLAGKSGRRVSIQEALKAIADIDAGSNILRAGRHLQASNTSELFEEDTLVTKLLLGTVAQGRESILFTRSKTVLEQFVTLSRLLNFRYSCWSLGKKYPRSASPLSEIAKELDKSNRDRPRAKGSQLVQAIDDVVLPENGLPLMSQCWLLEENGPKSYRFYQAMVALERPMYHMFVSLIEEMRRTPNEKSRVLSRDAAIRSSMLQNKFKHELYDLDFLHRSHPDFPSEGGLELSTESIEVSDLLYVHNEGHCLHYPWLLQARLSKLRKDRKRVRKATLRHNAT